MEQINRACAVGFIENIWNQNRFDRIDDFLHPNFRDLSQPFKAVQNTSGLRLYLKEIGKVFTHNTTILDLHSEGEIVCLKVRIDFTLIEIPDLIEAGQHLTSLEGYRYLKMSEGRILDHWELLNVSQ
jgi:hypothetical protein